jgi:hypothetical protein
MLPRTEDDRPTATRRRCAGSGPITDDSGGTHRFVTLYMKPYDGGARVGVSKVSDAAERFSSKDIVAAKRPVLSSELIRQNKAAAGPVGALTGTLMASWRRRSAMVRPSECGWDAAWWRSVWGWRRGGCR